MTKDDQALIDNGLGNCHLSAGLSSGAKDELSKASALLTDACMKEPSNIKFRRDLARCQAAMQMEDAACGSLLTALEINEFDPLVLYELGLYYFADKKYKKATKFLKHSLHCHPDPMWINNTYYHIGLAYARLQKFEKSIFPFTKCIERDPGNIQYMHERAKAYQHINLHEEAV